MFMQPLLKILFITFGLLNFNRMLHHTSAKIDWEFVVENHRIYMSLFALEVQSSAATYCSIHKHWALDMVKSWVSKANPTYYLIVKKILYD